jgi:hypothetical protein
MLLNKLAAYLAPLYLPALLAIGVWPQPRSINGVPIGDMPEQLLKSHHIALTRRSLVAALRNDDAEVRKLAAGVLANRWPNDTASEIEGAMLREPVIRNRICMAFDLAKLRNRAGREMLINECHKRGNWGSDRVLAARFMSDLHDDSCVDSIIDILQSNSDPNDTVSKEGALDLVPNFIGRLTQHDSQRVFELVANALDDPAPGVRMNAGDVLVRLRDVTAIPRLEAAIAREQEETCRDALERDLKQLQKVKQAHQ